MGMNFTVTRKVTLGYLVVLLFSMTAIGYALVNLHDHERRTQQLVGGQFTAFSLLRDLRQNLLGQENLEKQLVILRDPQLLGLLEKRAADIEKIISEVEFALLPDYFRQLPDNVAEYNAKVHNFIDLCSKENWEQAGDIAAKTTTPLRNHLLTQLADLRTQHQAMLDKGLYELSLQTGKAYQMTLMISLIGILLSAPVALTLISNIHRSIKVLTKATHDIAAGGFETRIDIHSKDEFGQLARDFTYMAEKLVELKQLNLDANPLTQLPGNLAIDRELEQRINAKRPFAHMYIDLDNFKAYSDHYGYKAGSDVIHMVGELLKTIVKKQGSEDDLVGHIGGDDYVVLTEPQYAEKLAKSIISAFDRHVPELYTPEDFRAGFVFGTDRHGIKRSFPLLTISIAITLSENFEEPKPAMISHNCARMKSHLKQLKNSNYLIDRRRQLK